MAARKKGAGSIRRYGSKRFLATVCRNYKQYRKVCDSLEEAQSWIAATLTALQCETPPVTSADMIAASIAKSELPPDVSLSQVIAYYIRHHQRTGGTTIAEAVAQFLADKSRAGLRPGSLRNLRWHCERLSAQLGPMPIRAATTQDLAAALDTLYSREPSAGRNDTRRAWMNLWNWSIRAGLTDANPVGAITKTKTDELTPDCYTPEQVAALLRAAATGPRHHRAMLPVLAIGFFAGLRIGEIARLEWSDVNRADGHIHIRGAAAKMRTRRYATINPTLAAWLDSIPPRSGPLMRVRERARIMRFVSVRAAAAVPFIRNGIRHSFASYHLALHMDATRTAFELGHTRPDLLYRHYRNLVTRAAAEAYWKLTPDMILQRNQQRRTHATIQPQS